jgi:hypothetical protein
LTTQPTPPPEPLTELRLIDELKQVINTAYIPNDRPMVVAYVDEAGMPQVSFRGSVLAYSDTQLALWARNAGGGLPTALAKHPNVALIYREGNPDGPFSRATLTFRGRGRVVEDEATRRQIYDAMPERERDRDRDYNGVAIIVDLDQVNGGIPGFRFQMRR